MIKMVRPMISAAPSRVAAPVKLAEQFYSSPEWRSLMVRIKRDRGNKCEVNGCCSGHKLIIGDHIVERRDGGAALDPANIRLMCLPCHNAKTAKARKARFGH